MATISDIQPPPKAPSFSATLDRSNPLGFVEKALAFLARESDFFHRERVEREVASVVRTLREKERKKVERKKKADAEAAKLMEMEGSERKADAEAAKLMEMEGSEKKADAEAAKKLEMEGSEKKADAEAAELMEMESSEKKMTSETSSSSIPHFEELNSLSLLVWLLSLSLSQNTISSLYLVNCFTVEFQFLHDSIVGCPSSVATHALHVTRFVLSHTRGRVENESLAILPVDFMEHVRETMEELANGKKLRGPATKRIKPAKDFYPVASRYYDTLKNNPPQEDSWLLHREVYAGKIDRRVFVHVYASTLADEHEIKESERRWMRKMRAHRKVCENHDDTCCDSI